jgi:acyl-CoA thioester hydrolase
MKAPQRSDFRFFLRLATRWGDMDVLGHVNNAKFFTYDESARLEYFQRLMQDDPRFWKDYGLILAHIEADFLAQLKPPAQLDIGFRIARIGRSSLRTEAAMFLDDRAVAVTRGIVVWFDYSRNTPLPVPDAVRAKIRAYETVKPEETA